MNNTLINDGSKQLFLDFSYLQNVMFKENMAQLDLIVEKFNIENIKTYQEFQNILRTSMLKQAFICLVDDKARKFSSKNKDQQVFDAIIRMELNSETQSKMPENTYIGFFVNINYKTPYLTISSIFQTRLKPIAQEFETIIPECDIQIIKNQREVSAEEILRRSIINSETVGTIKKIQSNFENEKSKWLNYLDFLLNFLDVQRKKSLPYLNSKIYNLIKINKIDFYKELRGKEIDFIKNRSNVYFDSKFETLIKNFQIPYEVTQIVVLDVLCDSEKAIEKLKKMQELVLAPFKVNKALPPLYNLQENISAIFSFDFERTKENIEVITLNSLLAITSNNETLEKYWEKNKEIIFGSKTELEQAKKNLKQELNEWKIYKIMYEIETEVDKSLFEGKNDVNKLQAGYLAYIGIGEDVLIDRYKQVLKRISEGNIKNPYLVNYLFNTKLLQLADTNDEIKIDDVEFKFNLNKEQKQAVVKAMKSKDILLIQGPPGTGKTQVICEIIYQLSIIGRKILISSQNHEAINNVINRLPYEPSINRIRLTNQINIKSKLNNNFSPERVVYNYYKSIVKSVYDDMVVDYSTINEFSQVEVKLEQLLNIYKSQSQNNSQIFNLSKSLDEINIKIKEIKTKEINYISKRNNLKNTIFNIENLIVALTNYEFNITIDVSDDIKNVYINEVKYLMDRFTIINLKKIINENNLFEEIKELCNQILFKDEIFNGIINAKNKALQYKKQAEFEIANQEIEKIATFEKALLKNSTISEFIIIIKKFIEVLNNLKVDLDYNLQKLNDTSLLSKDLTNLEVQKNELLVKNQNIKNQYGDQDKELIEMLKYINQKFNINLIPTDDNFENHIKMELNKYSNQLQASKQRNEEFKEFFLDITSYINNNYSITNNWNEEVPTKDFSLEMIRETKKYSNSLLNNLVNIYGMTLTSPNFFKYNNDEFAKKIGLEEISLKSMDVDVVIIDEVSKATLIEILMPLIYGKTLILVGDYRQLPPILKLQESDIEYVNKLTGKNFNFQEIFELLDKSVFKTLIAANNKSITTMLKTQYRSHSQIMEIVNKFYDNELTVDQHVSDQKKHGLTVISKYGEEIIGSKSSVYWIDSSLDLENEIYFEQTEGHSTSLYNDLEIKITVEILKQIDTALIKKVSLIRPSVAVISFYSLHVTKLKKHLKKYDFKNFDVIISTVDDFQGKEADYVIVNMIRNPERLSSKNGRDFLKKYERINVAFSRAKELLIIVGAQRTVSDITVQIPTIDNPNISNTYEVYADIIAKIEFDGGLLATKDII